MTMEARTKDPLAEIDFLDTDSQDNPYSVYADMLTNHPIFYSERYCQFFAFSADAVRNVMINRDFTVASPFRATHTLFGPTVVDIDGKDHLRLRIALSDAVNIRKNKFYR